MPKIQINRPFYAMASSDGVNGEITMYGEIVETQPIDWWTGKPIEGQYIIQKEFLDDLEQIAGCKKLTLRMNSGGGDAGVSLLIHNRLRELANAGTEIECIVDGIAMSGGSLIMCAASKVKVNPSSIIMIHKCWTYIWGAYNADELKQVATSNDAWDKAQAAIYARKTGLSETVILHMMADTTYMTGKEAVEKGFADELIEDAEPLAISASADRTAIKVNGRTIHLARGMSIPESIPISTDSQPDDINTLPENAGANEEGGNLMATNLEELRKENAELAAVIEGEVRAAILAENTQAIDAAVQAERSRLKEIDEIAGLFSDDLVEAAKYEKPCTAQELAFNAAQEAAKTGKAFMAKVDDDYSKSDIDKVGAAPESSDEKTEEEKKSEIKALLRKKEEK